MVRLYCVSIKGKRYYDDTTNTIYLIGIYWQLAVMNGMTQRINICVGS